MKNSKQSNGHKKVTIEQSGSNSSNKGNESIFETAINPRLQQFSYDLLERYHQDGMLNQMHFFLGLSQAFGDYGWKKSPNLILFKPMIDSYNSFMLQHQLLGEVVEEMMIPFPMLYDDFSMENVIGKYHLYSENGIPQLLLSMPDNNQEFAKQQIACSLLDYIYELIDIRKIEASIPELDGLCNYLKSLAPDEFHGYCTLGDQINYNAPLDLDGYKEFLEQIKSLSR